MNADNYILFDVAGTSYAGIGADETFTCDGAAAECL